MKKVIPTLLVLVAMIFAEGVWLDRSATKTNVPAKTLSNNVFSVAIEKEPNSLTTDYMKLDNVQLPKDGSRSITYSVEWTITLDHIASVGVTPVCIGSYPQGETLLWVASAGRTGSGDPNWILIYNLNSRTLVDSFQQATTTTWGYRDMCFYNGYVYAGVDNVLHKIDPVSKTVVGSYTVSGITGNVIRALTDNNVEDSLWTANFAQGNAIYKFHNEGGTVRTAASNTYALYGLGLDPVHNVCWGSSQTSGADLVKYSYPAFTALDYSSLPELEGGLAGGCEMWKDTFLLYLGQCTPNDKVFCIRLYGFVENDMKVLGINAPSTIIPFQRFSIQTLVQNVGSNTQLAGVPVKMRITGPGGYLYEDLDQTTTTQLVQGDTQRITFTPQWQAPNVLGVYTLKAWTELPNDQNPSNDTMTATIEVTNWITYATWTTPFYWYPLLTGEKATRFYPLEFGIVPPVTIDTIEALFYKTNIRDSVFKFRIYDSDGTTLRYESGELTVSGPTGTFITMQHIVDPAVTITGNNFYVSVWCRSDSQPNLLSDQIPLGRSFYGSAGNWTTNTSGEWNISAFVSWEARMNDVSITEITIPGPRPIWVGETRTVKVKIKNYGLNTQTSIPIAFYPGHGSEVNETWTGSLASGEEVEYQFTTQWNCNTVGSLFNFKAYTKLTNDEYRNNDTATVQIAVCSPAGHTPTYTKDFNEQWGTFGDNPPFCGWMIQDYGNEPTPTWNFNDWFHGSLSNPPRSVAAARYDIHNNPPELQDEWLISPRLNCSGAGTYTLSFWHWYRGYSTEPDTGYVLLSTDGGSNWTLIDLFAGGSDLTVVDSGYKTYDITALVSGYDNVKIAFRYYALDAYWWLIDDFVVTRTPPPGPATWNQSVPIPTNDPPKYVKDGGAMVATNNGIYAFKGWKSAEFKLFDGTAWTDKASIPFTVKPGTDKENKKYPGKGASLCWDGANTIYAIKGNGTREFWKYDIPSDTWIPDSFVPAAKLKGGSSITYDNGKVYLLAAGQSQNVPNFFAYNVATSTWSTLASAPHEPHNKKWGDGSALSAMNGVIYALKGKDKWNLFLAFTESGGWTFLETIPQAYDTSMIAKPKKTKVGDGGALTNDGTYLYAIKGAGKQDFWAYDPVTNRWAGLCTIPRLNKPSVPKTGAALAYWDYKVYLLKGNKLNEFWYYGVAPIEFKKTEPATIVSTTNNTTNELTFNFIANPFSRTINYTVPMSGKVTIKLYNVSGRLIQTLNDGHLEAGKYTTLLPKVSSGVYFLKYHDGINSAEAKIIVQ